MTTVEGMAEHAGVLIRNWRQRRHVSQLDLAHRAGVSTRHVSFIETGRSSPSSAMILRLCEHLAVPLRDQNKLLLAAGFAPAHPEHGMADPPMAQASQAIDQILNGHNPFPALVIDQGWDLVAANEGVYRMLDGLPADVLEPPVNVLRLSLDPRGLAPRIVNLAQWHEHLVARLERELDASADPRLAELLAEVGPAPQPQANSTGTAEPSLVVPLQLRVGDDVWSLLSTTTVFGTPREVTLSELAIEAFYPADDETRALMTAS